MNKAIHSKLYRPGPRWAAIQPPSNQATTSHKTIETVTQIHRHFYTTLITLLFPISPPPTTSVNVAEYRYMPQYISGQDESTLSLGVGGKGSF